MLYAPQAPVHTASSAPDTADRLRRHDDLPLAADLFFESGLALAIPLALSMVIDVCLEVAGVGHFGHG